MTLHQNNEPPGQANQISLQGESFVNVMQLPMSDKKPQQNGDLDEQRDPQSFRQLDPYVTSYVCLLVPRFEEHLLIGDLADLLPIWLKEICISFGWQLKFIDIKPNYLHWIMTVSITTFPTKFMKIVCRESSRKILDDFPKFKQKNMSDDFWAPWYLVGVGQAPYSQESIQSYIKQIRMEQGLY